MPPLVSNSFCTLASMCVAASWVLVRANKYRLRVLYKLWPGLGCLAPCNTSAKTPWAWECFLWCVSMYLFEKRSKYLSGFSDMSLEQWSSMTLMSSSAILMMEATTSNPLKSDDLKSEWTCEICATAWFLDLIDKAILKLNYCERSCEQACQMSYQDFPDVLQFPLKCFWTL